MCKTVDNVDIEEYYLTKAASSINLKFETLNYSA
jgi:hypothetical protein